jgi:hypothetical protein
MLPIVGSILSSVLGGSSAPSNTTATSGDATAGLSFPFNYGGNVQAGGTGNSQSQPTNQTAQASPLVGAGSGAAPDNTLVYVALGVAALALLASAVRR